MRPLSSIGFVFALLAITVGCGEVHTSADAALVDAPDWWDGGSGQDGAGLGDGGPVDASDMTPP